MHLFLVRHGETEHNVAGLLAGVTDSNLTNHGIIQAQRLGKYLTTNRGLRFGHLYASDLKRAWMTADEIRKAQSANFDGGLVAPQVVQLTVLREQDFGSLELVSWSSKRGENAVDTHVPSALEPNFKPKETQEAMRIRADQFLDDFVLPLLALDVDDGEECIAVVSHGLFLACLWRTLLDRFNIKDVVLGPEAGVFGASRPVEHLGAWSNTGYLELMIKKQTNISSVLSNNNTLTSKLLTYNLTILAINEKEHLQSLKRMRGGLGTATYDTRQKDIAGFFKRQKSETGNENSSSS